ncbi:OmpA family protein [Paraburkholderia sp. DGU8]|uniref:OmpA family protein n=1 Tax=Paraburkholderia sp. DGU8 TaxID=3161997 RepID=UPI0034668573
MKISSDSKHVEANTAGHEDDIGEQSGRWLISYADLITTLMVLFLALYVLQLSRNKELESRLFEQQRTAAVAARAPERADGKQQLLSLLEPLREKRQITISSVPHGVEIAINAKILFNTGDAHLLPESSDVLAQVATILRLHSTHNILVEGHTDSVPISTAKFESNWELSSARAGAVVRFFADKGIAAHRLAAIGRADNFPLIIGDDAAARAANRRVTILVEG